MALTLGACSLLTSLDGFSEPTPATSAEASAEAASDGGGDASVTIDGPAEATTDAAPFDCDAAGLVAFYGFDEGAGGLVHDCSPHHLGGTFDASAGNTAWGTRGGSGAITFTGYDGRVTIPAAPELDMPGAFTIAGFFRVDAPPSSYVSLAWHYPGLGWEITFAADAAYAQVRLASGELLFLSFPPIAMAKWKHLAAVYEPGVRLEIYVDGTSAGKLSSLDGGALPNVPAATANAALTIGSVFDGTSWSGGADDLAIFARALSDAELAALAAR
jgi:hypothetical protein